MIRVFEPSISVKDVYSVAKSVLNKDISGSSKEVKIFEKNLAKYFQRKYAVCLSNGSVALDAAFQALNLKKGDEVILPTFTIISCLAAVIRSGATPIFCDVDAESWNLNLDDVKPLITEKTRAILIVHTYGLIVKADDFEEFCRKKNIVLIEDAAEAHGQQINNRKIGSFGLMSTFSFYANKHVTTGEGGAVLTDSEDVYKKLLQIRNLDFNLNKRFEHDNLYWNYRMSGLQAALGNSQLKKLNQNIINKLKQANIYNNLIKEANLDIKTHPESFNGAINHYWVYGVVLNKSYDRDKIIMHLYNNKIETRPFFTPLHLQKAYKGIDEERIYPVSEFIGQQGLYLPLGNHLNKSKQNKIIKILDEALQFYV